MACDHKFRQYLHLERLDFEPETLIVGTFNPAWPADNAAEWFYGRPADSCFWDVLPRVYGSPSLINATHTDWKRFCRQKRVAITDLIACIDDAHPANPKHQAMLGSFTDNAIIHNFEDFTYVDIVQLLRRHPSIKNVYITRGVTEAFWRHLWYPVAHYCNHNHIRERKLLPPSAEAAYQHEAYNNEHPEAPIHVLQDYILMRWQQEWQVFG